MSENGNKILTTKDYNLFKFIKGNRQLDERHVQSLEKAMKHKDLFVPIAVNERMEVMDGQHRLEARKRIGLTIPYYITGDYGLEEVQALNARQKTWTNNDFMHSYIALGRKDYEIYQWFRQKYRIPHCEAVVMLTGDLQRNTGSEMSFKTGTFKVTDISGAKEIAEMLVQIEPYYERWNKRGFVAAFLQLFPKKVFDFNVFLQRLESQPAAMKDCANTEQYIELIETIYNYRAKNKVSLKYGD